jgi:hypothetical protein
MSGITRRSNGKITVGSRFAQFSLTVFFRLAWRYISQGSSVDPKIIAVIIGVIGAIIAKKAKAISISINV